MAPTETNPAETNPANPAGGAAARPETEMADWTELADLAEATARQAAALLLDGLGRVRVAVDTKSTTTDMVTEMDRASEHLITDALTKARPNDGLLGEEGASRAGTSGVRWVIDPLDGTTNYLYGHPGFAVSIAAERNGRSVVGVVADVMTGELYRAVLGRGATCDGAPLRVSTETELGQALVATGFGYRPEQRRHQGAVLAQVIGEVRDIRRMGSAALDLCSVARGRVDAYYELSLGAWDFAAGALIAAEAGAEVMDLDGRPPGAAPLLAAPPALAEPLRQLLLGAGATAS